MFKELSSQEFIFEIKNGNQLVLKPLYRHYSEPFRNWIARIFPNCRNEDIIDAFQEAVTTLYFNIMEGIISELTSSIKTYLFAIGKNKILDKMKKKDYHHLRLTHSSNDESLQIPKFEHDIEKRYRKEHQKKVVQKLLDRIGVPCSKVLEFAFFKNYDPESIARAMGYKGEAIARVRKSSCLKQLGELFKNLGMSKQEIFE